MAESSSLNFDLDTKAISHALYVEADAADKIDYQCNVPGCEISLWQGYDWDFVEIDWLKMGIEHIFEKHPELLKAT